MRIFIQRLVATPRSTLFFAALTTLFAVGCSSSDGDNNNTPEPESGQLIVRDRAARSCEALIEATGGQLVGADFSDGTTGQAIPQGDRAGIAIVSDSAEPLPESAGTLRFLGELKVVASTCYDENGNALSGNGVEI